MISLQLLPNKHLVVTSQWDVSVVNFPLPFPPPLLPKKEEYLKVCTAEVHQQEISPGLFA